MKTCPYCDCELSELNVVRGTIKLEKSEWRLGGDPCPLICCPHCDSALDATDLDMLGVPHDVIKEATK